MHAICVPLLIVGNELRHCLVATAELNHAPERFWALYPGDDVNV